MGSVRMTSPGGQGFWYCLLLSSTGCKDDPSDSNLVNQTASTFELDSRLSTLVLSDTLPHGEGKHLPGSNEDSLTNPLDLEKKDLNVFKNGKKFPRLSVLVDGMT